MPQPSTTAGFVLALACSAPLLAQTDHVVGPGGLPEIRDALAIAAPGDVITVQPGSYAHFTASVGVTIRAAIAGTVQVEFDPAYAPPGCAANPFCGPTEAATHLAPPAGQTLHVVDIDFAPTLTGGYAHHRVLVDSGTVALDGCTIAAFDATALGIGSATVHLQSCIVNGYGSVTSHALVANGADLIAVDCTMVGSTVGGLAFPGDGVRVTNCSLKASGCYAAGGANIAGGIGGAALRTDATSRIWISDSTLVGGGTTCAVVGTAAIGRIARSTLTPTVGSCGLLLAGPVVGVERGTPLQNGTTFTMTVHTEPFALVAIHAGPGLGTLPIPGLFEQPVALDLTAFFLAGVFVADANGDLQAGWNMPAGMFVGQPLWLEAIRIGPTPPWQVGPIVGGVIR